MFSAFGIGNRRPGFEAMDANLRESFRVLAAGRSASDLAELDGVSICSLGVAFRMFNAAFLNSTVEDARALASRLSLARDRFAAAGRSWSFWFSEEWLARSPQRSLVDTCEGFGLHPAAEVTGMAATELRPAKRSLPALDFRPVSGDSAVLQDFRFIGATCFHVIPAWFNEVFDETIHSRPFRCWVGYYGDHAVATAATTVSDGVIGIYNVATLPEARGRGYAEAVTRHAAAAAQRESGLNRLILQATPQGESLYRRLGFRDVSRIVVFNS